MFEFDPTATLTESIIVKYFEKSLKLFSKAKKNQDVTQLNDYKELVSKTIKAKVKAGLKLSLYI